MITVPQDAVIMVLLCWVEPEIEFLFSPCADTSIGIDICLNNPVISLIMTKQFNIYLIMVVRKFICIRQLMFSLVNFSRTFITSKVNIIVKNLVNEVSVYAVRATIYIYHKFIIK